MKSTSDMDSPHRTVPPPQEYYLLQQIASGHLSASTRTSAHIPIILKIWINREICLFGGEGDVATFQKLRRPFARLWKTLASSLTSAMVVAAGIGEARMAGK